MWKGEDIFMGRLSKNKLEWLGFFIIFGVIVSIQMSILSFPTLEYYKKFSDVLYGLALIDFIIMIYYSYVGFRYRRMLNIYIVLVCIGGLGSILQCLEFMNRINPTGGVEGLRQFIMMPYIISVLLSIIIFIIKNKSDKLISDNERFKYSGILRKLVRFLLFGIAIIFLISAIYFVLILENGILFIWSIITSFLLICTGFSLRKSDRS